MPRLFPNFVGNAARGIGDAPVDVVLGLLKKSAPGIAEDVASESAASNALKNTSKLADNFDAATQAVKDTSRKLTSDNPLGVMFNGGGTWGMIHQNPLNYGSVKNYLLHELPELTTGLTAMPHFTGPLAATQYGAGITSALSKALNASGLSQAAKDYFIQQSENKEKK